MNAIFGLIENKAAGWINQEKQKSQSVIGGLIKHIEKENKLREPQKQAIEVYFWLKFVGNNQKISDIIRKGLLYDEEKAQEYDNFYNFGNNCAAHFLNQFFQDNSLNNLQRKLANDPMGKKADWNKFLEELLHNYDYPNYIFSLPMGAGKTYLMACFIYLDLYFANLHKTDKRFAHNFIVLAPPASKTAILPSLQTIKNFNPEWIIPKNEADKLKRLIQIEILDTLSSQRKDKLQGNNPNLEKVSRISQTKNFGMVFITNAEKFLERYEDKDKIYTDPKSLLYDPKKSSQYLKTNELREKLSQIGFLGVILDEVHHSYRNSNDEKKLRDSVNILNQHKNVISVLGFSGTPYIKHKVKIGGEEVKLNQIQDIVYNYYLNQGIGRFLKIPEIKKADIKEDLFVERALSDFFANFDIKYRNGAKSKIAFYCPSIKVLNEKILPAVQDWYKKNRIGQESEIFKFYSDGKKENKQYELPKYSLATFNNLDKPYSEKRVILLVAIGKEGWDCKSLTAVVLPRQKTTKNFVLQTTCRCLREMDSAAKEKALIYLEKDNYETLDNELKENYNLSITDLKFIEDQIFPVKIRKPKLGKLKYRQVETKYSIVSKKIKADNLNNFDFAEIKAKYGYDRRIIASRIGQAGLVAEREAKYASSVQEDYSFNDFIYDLARETFGKFSEIDLLAKYQKELENIFEQIKSEADWIKFNPNLEIIEVVKCAASFLAEEIETKKEILAKDAEIELLEWEIPNPSLPLYRASGSLADFMPKFANKNQAEMCAKYPEIYEKELPISDLDSQDISFNYAPYKMDSGFEINALSEMLKTSEMAGLEVYYNGYKGEIENFWIQTPDGVYTPDFLVLRRKGGKKYKTAEEKGEIEKILIVEIKGEIYDNSFGKKENFVKHEFIKHNPNFEFVKFTDQEGRNNFAEHIDEFKKIIKNF